MPFDCRLLSETEALVAYDDGSLRRFSLACGEEIQKWQPFPTTMTCLAVSPDGSLWMGSPLKWIARVDADWQKLHRLELPVAGMNCLLAESNILYLGGWDGRLRVLRKGPSSLSGNDDWQISHTLAHHAAPLNDLLLIKDFPIRDARLPHKLHTHTLVVASADGSITLWDLEQLK